MLFTDIKSTSTLRTVSITGQTFIMMLNIYFHWSHASVAASSGTLRTSQLYSIPASSPKEVSWLSLSVSTAVHSKESQGKQLYT